MRQRIGRVIESDKKAGHSFVQIVCGQLARKGFLAPWKSLMERFPQHLNVGECITFHRGQVRGQAHGIHIIDPAQGLEFERGHLVSEATREEWKKKKEARPRPPCRAVPLEAEGPGRGHGRRAAHAPDQVSPRAAGAPEETPQDAEALAANQSRKVSREPSNCSSFPLPPLFGEDEIQRERGRIRARRGEDNKFRRDALSMDDLALTYAQAQQERAPRVRE